MDNFTVWNDNAKIIFLEPVSLFNENVEEEILLEHLGVQIHPGQDVASGLRLNKSRRVILRQFFDEKSRLMPEKMLRAKAMRFVGCNSDMQFVDYDYM